MGAHCAFKKLHVCLEYTQILAHKAVAPEGGELPRFTPASRPLRTRFTLAQCAHASPSPSAHARCYPPDPAGAVNRTSSTAAGGVEC